LGQILRSDIDGKERGDGFGRLGLGQFGEEEAQIATGLMAVGFGLPNDAVKGGRGAGAIGGIGEEPIAQWAFARPTRA
jgi:hypothetical protein